MYNFVGNSTDFGDLSILILSLILVLNKIIVNEMNIGSSDSESE